MSWNSFKSDIEQAIETRNMRRAAKVDANQTKVVASLRKAGLSVAVTSMVGNGFPDLVVAGNYPPFWNRKIKTKTILVELKNPDMPPSGQKLTPDEIDFMDSWKGEYLKTNNVDDILKTFGLI